MWRNRQISANEIVDALVEQDHKDHVSAPADSVLRSQDFKKFLLTIHKEVMGYDSLPTCLHFNEDISLVSRYAYNILIYRAALTNVKEFQEEYDTNYKEFLTKDNFYTRGLISGNPFIIRAHVVKLYSDALKALNDSSLSKEDHIAFSKLIEQTSVHINHMDNTHYAGVKNLLDGYLNYTLSLLAKSAEGPQELKDKLLASIVSSTKLSLEMSSQTQDKSCELYGNTHTNPALPFPSAKDCIDAMTKLNLDQPSKLQP